MIKDKKKNLTIAAKNLQDSIHSQIFEIEQKFDVKCSVIFNNNRYAVVCMDAKELEAAKNNKNNTEQNNKILTAAEANEIAKNHIKTAHIEAAESIITEYVKFACENGGFEYRQNCLSPDEWKYNANLFLQHVRSYGYSAEIVAKPAQLINGTTHELIISWGEPTKGSE